MDNFEVRAKDTSLLESSHIVKELQSDSADMDTFPVLIDGQIGYFHDIDGGFNEYHVVNLIHRVQGVGSPPTMGNDSTVEIHLDDAFYNLDVIAMYEMGEYPDDDYVLSLKVTDYKIGPYSFSEAMSADIDKRHEEFSHNNK